jgi:hypothetical protein
VQLFSDFIVRLLKRVPLYRTLAARMHARAFERMEPRLVEARPCFAESAASIVHPRHSERR